MNTVKIRCACGAQFDSPIEAQVGHAEAGHAPESIYVPTKSTCPLCERFGFAIPKCAECKHAFEVCDDGTVECACNVIQVEWMEALAKAAFEALTAEVSNMLNKEKAL